MHYELISAEEYDNLPDDPQEQFVELEGICRRNMTKMISNQTPVDFDRIVRMQYMTTVASAAQELDIEGILYPYNADDPVCEIDIFLLKVSGVVTRIRLRSRVKNRQYSVQLGIRTRAKIEIQIIKLRDIISQANLPESKRMRLLEKLDALSIELNKTRLGFAKAMLAIAGFSALALSEGAGLLADAPEAIATITSLIGQDKEAEDSEQLRLMGPANIKSLPAPEVQKANVDAASFDLDDEIPF
ncbi:hypothetical protein Q1W73_04270 [Asticcacaulis sp. ZE23SCel15]|uniref:hypothetical protein n=1 Tax=Asticcacaulis sp. ZE23SCel15 TaxID=3059027 RepID=UPI00265E1CF9|nr:hypothetical protein [Asticcacaulis sp. ZE23SCel15]WKL58204.1 hypothetical protein Q1W73_04270 [Asticcacaulis sp. ZE23SCel15]